MFYDYGKIRVRESKRDDVDFLKSRLRQSDIEEIWASDNVEPEEALATGFEHSLVCYTIENGRPICMFGITPESIIGDKAIIWLLGSDDIEKIQYRFVRYSRIFIKIMLENYSLMYNFVDDRNTKSIKWLRACGATVEEPKPYGVEGKMFRYFYFKKEF